MTDSVSVSSLSSLDITRNPFESTQDRLNFPGYSPSMFTKQDTPASERVSTVETSYPLCFIYFYISNTVVYF